jgi:UDP-N-acetylmuramoyl-tripeptide--D-alanyl-D-alanine ligase
VYHRVLITQSVRKLKNHTGMRVVGITGSYGKTSTKEFMATILGARFHVLKTHASQNSPIGIAEAIVKNIKKNHDVFIVEMGAYKRGEIAEMTRMVHPSIGLVTAVNAQHQDLFGTLDTTVKAKYELIEGLPRNGIAILNAENTYTRKMGEWAQSSGRPVWWYSVRKPDSRKYAKALWASDIQTNIRGVSFICHMGERHGKVSVPVLGAHQVSIILGAIAGAVACGMDFTDALQATSKITSVPKTMEPVRGVNGSLFINDTFTNNPDAARAALAFLEHTKGRKIFVFQPMIELGTYTVPSHEDVGKYAASICDDIILTNSNFLDAFRRGVERIVPHKEIRVMGDRDAARYIARTVTGTDTVLFKGKESERILRRLVSLTV